ncbi:uncharacterized protein A1O9_10350 [Exophiala aquamarina CBS 119918]|uniref:FAD/NAD(P)-binding domain-containing protein n=1 Tax=Exophiala aquamarina CBS 119918 TaxID=1182545 RepID=A0A072PCU8_9EURO|nr:uncharacterized protein A1O9_10350 [Exophiala aquamarina CBS 119918]KEF53375.1 hypothetical protein A1O9_10350 [Exophiala aquamarina CBS 119918]
MAPHAEVLPLVEFSFSKHQSNELEKVILSPQILELVDNQTEAETIKEPFQRTPSYPIEQLPGALPDTKISPSINHVAVVDYCLRYLDQFNVDVFCQNGIWRDIYALTGLPRTFYGPQGIHSAWTELEKSHHPSTFRLIEGTSKVVDMGNGHSWIQARFSFVTSGAPITKCSGQIGIVPDLEFGWKIWFLTTILEEIEGLPNPDSISPEIVKKGPPKPKNSDTDFDCIIVGAGFAGLCLAGRLKAMGISYLIIEKNENIGDNWTSRYDSARFHTSKYYSDMPLGNIFGEDYDYFPSGKELARGYQAYVEKHQINVSLSSCLQSASFDQKINTWTINFARKGETKTIKAPHFVFAIGAGGTIPKMPQLPGREKFNGIVIHSATYKNASEWKGKRCVIVGVANTAHDVAEDMLDAGAAEVTMIQRGRTSVFPIEHYKAWSDPIYNETSKIEDADRQIMALPLVVTRLAALHGGRPLVDAEPERFDSLERAGFRVERYGDLWKLLTDRLGGHYMDVGASAKVSAGLIKIKGDAALTAYDETGLVFSDGSHLDADVVVFCTGYSHDVRGQATRFVGQELGEHLDDYWEIDHEGELRGVYKPHGIPGIWYTGGGVTFARFYSRFLALQIGGDVSDKRLKVYNKKYLRY